MKFTLGFLSSLLLVSTTSAASSLHKRNVFNKVKPTLEKRVADQPFQHPELQKRATRFLNPNSESQSTNNIPCHALTHH